MSNLPSFGSSSKISRSPLIGRPLADAQSYICSLKQAGTMYRVIHPGQKVRLDYRPERVNIRVDKNGNISRITQG